MGCGASLQTQPLSSQQDEVSRSFIDGIDGDIETSGKTKGNSMHTAVVFKVLPSEVEARKKFEADGTLAKNSDAGHLALRTMLDEPLSQNSLGKFAAKIQVLDIFMCWIDIQEYKVIPTQSYRRSKALHIYHKYIKDDAVLMVGVTTAAEREKYWSDLQLAKDDPTILTPQFYDNVQTKCFINMYDNIYIPFTKTDEYQSLTSLLKNKYNKVKINDFDYYNKLGEGGFGFVVHCKKKSTGKHYAMKLQLKNGLLDCYKDEPFKVSLEKDAFATLQHPFIVNLYYAFQTPSLVVMVLDLADCGDLHTNLANAQQNKFPEPRVRFYIAEIILALAYLHQRGLIYRDLKPQNVLLNSDGHVQLVDLGGVMDDDGEWTRKQQNEVQSSILPLFSKHSNAMRPEPIAEVSIENHQPFIVGGEDNTATNSSTGNATEQKEESEPEPAGYIGANDTTAEETAVPDSQSQTPSGATKPQSTQPKTQAQPQVRKPPARRKQSIMGTLGYMAPEMVIMLSRPQPMYGGESPMDRTATKKLVRKGYTNAVDWWSLGVTAYKLLTGQRPFGDKQMYNFVELATTMHQAVGENIQFKEYSMLFQKLTFPNYVSPTAQDFISKLLDVSDITRLGSGENGVDNIKKHPFFTGLDWDLLEQKQIEPPFKPNKPKEYNNLQERDLKSILILSGKGHYLDQVPLPEQQKYFESWDFISPHTLRVEAGLSQMMEQLVTNKKARMIMGESQKEDNLRLTEKSGKR